MNDRTLEKLVSKLVELNLQGIHEANENFSHVAVDIFDGLYGKTCNLTVLMKKPFRMSDSDYFHEVFRYIKKVVKTFFPILNDINNSVSTIDTYNQRKERLNSDF